MGVEAYRETRRQFRPKERLFLSTHTPKQEPAVESELPKYIGRGLFKRKVTRGTALSEIPGSEFYDARTDSILQPFAQLLKAGLFAAGMFLLPVAAPFVAGGLMGVFFTAWPVAWNVPAAGIALFVSLLTWLAADFMD